MTDLLSIFCCYSLIHNTWDGGSEWVEFYVPPAQHL